MAESLGVGKTINTWVQTVFIVIAALWGIYTFVYKEIKVPRAAPINITMNLDLKKVGVGRTTKKTAKQALEAIEMKISATNPSTREVYLLSSAWVASGVKIGAEDREGAFLKDVNELLKSRQEGYRDKHATSTANLPIASGNLFRDSSLKPGETITRSIIFYVPAQTYDLLSVVAVMPTTARAEKFVLEWNLNEQGDLNPTVFRLGPDGKREEMQKDPSGVYSDPKLELQMAESSSQLSLWQ